MGVWTVRGGNRLYGETEIQGAKNSVLPILAACMMCDGKSVITNCPDISDVAVSEKILNTLGCRTSFSQGTFFIETSDTVSSRVPHELMEEMRSSVLFLGVMLAKSGQALISLPGGCELGDRPIDLHLEALRSLGAIVSDDNGEIYCRAGRLKGAEIYLPIPSVGATENAMIAASTAEGTTTIINAAREPEIVDLADFLNLAGAEIHGAGSSIIVIEGVNRLHGVEYRIMGDRIAAATYMCATAATGGDVYLTGVQPEHLKPVTQSLKAMGCSINTGYNRIRIRSDGILDQCGTILTEPYPGFPTDAQPLLLAASLRAAGTGVFVENIFSNRFRYTQELRRFGGDIRVIGNAAIVSGCKALHGARATATDLRGGAAMIIAALTAHGISEITDPGHICRGYDDLDGRFRALGADISYSH